MLTPIAASTIAAQAFRLMELGEISSFADDTKQAQSAAEQYPVALDTCLESYDWSFARRLVELPAVALPAALAPDLDLPYAVALPGELVALRAVIPEGTFWRVDENYLRSDQDGSLQIRYTRRIEDETTLPATFRTAVSAQLASLLSPRWVSSRSKRADLVNMASDYLAVARDNDRHTASHSRADGRARQGDWASEATL